jgi:GTP pyrophosphokinase
MVRTQALDADDTAPIPGAAEDLLQRARVFAREAGAPEAALQSAPAVVRILGALRLDQEVLVASILSMALQNVSPLPRDAIAKEFGPGVARLVDGVARMAFLHEGIVEKGKNDPAQAENLRKMLLAMAEDVRVVFIKLAERTHVMRTLKSQPDEQRRAIARETLAIFTPLANRLGIGQLKWELEDLAFRYLEPERYKDIAGLLDERRTDREHYIARVVHILRKELHSAGIAAELTGRPKHIYSIWRKMQNKGADFHQLFDVRAVRVLVNQVSDCYAALGVVHTLWPHIPGEFDDYIATPKDNMYRSLHTAVRGPDGKTLEVQIRTHEMHHHAELGVAAHWRYKEGGKFDAGFERKIAWLRQLLDWRTEGAEGGDLLERFKAEAFQDYVYVLTPKGEIVDLPQGATPLDFAYCVHTQVGHRCRGAKVNGRIVPLNYELHNGEQVEILTAKQGAPSRDWLSPHLGYLKTARARDRVRHWFKQQDLDKNQDAGRALLDRELRRLGVSGINYEKLAQKFGYAKMEDFMASLGRGDITATQIATAVQGLVKADVPQERAGVLAAKAAGAVADIRIQGVGNLLTAFARCCKPLPNDPVIGFITRGRGVTVHRRDCPNLLRLGASAAGRLIEVEWGGAGGGGEYRSPTYPVDIQVEAFDRPGLLRDITAILANEKINVVAVNVATDRKEHTAHMRLTLEIADIHQLSRVLERINQVPNVREARRQSG